MNTEAFILLTANGHCTLKDGAADWKLNKPCDRRVDFQHLPSLLTSFPSTELADLAQKMMIRLNTNRAVIQNCPKHGELMKEPLLLIIFVRYRCLLWIDALYGQFF